MGSKDKSKSKDGPWTEQVSSSGKKYFYNNETGISQWDKPEAMKEQERRAAERISAEADAKSSRPSTSKSDHKSLIKSDSRKSSSPAGGNHKAQRRTHPHYYNDHPPAKRPYIEQPANPILPSLMNPSLPLYQPPPPPYGQMHLDPPPQPPAHHHSNAFDNPPPPPPPPPPLEDEPMDLEKEDSPSKETEKTEKKAKEPALISIPTPDSRPFDEAPYMRLYDPKLNHYLRKHLISDNTLNDIKKGEEKLRRNELQMMELEASILSVKGLLCVADAKTSLFSDKLKFYDDQLDAIKRQQFNFNEQPKSEVSDTPMSPLKSEVSVDHVH